MFIRADNLLSDAPPDSFKFHVIRYSWEEFEPVLMVFDTDREEIRHLSLDKLSVIVSSAKRCTGYFDSHGYHACPSDSVVKSFSQCEECASSWIPKIACVFEPECDGEECDSPFCSKEHTVYVAFTGTKAKVGMTGSKRLRERGIEQGADAIAPLILCDSRYEARLMEKKISDRLKLPQRLYGSKLVKEYLRALPEEKLKLRLDDIRRKLDGTHELVEGGLEFLSGYPVENLDSVPQQAKVSGRHEGEVLGLRGKHLFYRSGEKTKMINMSDVVSRFLTEC